MIGRPLNHPMAHTSPRRHCMKNPSRVRIAFICVMGLTFLTGCSTWAPEWLKQPLWAAAAPAIAASGVPPGSPQPGGPPMGSAQTFASTTREAQKVSGLFTVFKREERAWLVLKPEDFGKPFFLAPKVTTGIGEAWMFGGMFEAARVVEFRRLHNQVQLIALNTRFSAAPGTPQARALGAAFSPSLLASAPVVSQPDPISQAVLIDLNSLFLNDMLGRALQLQRTYKQSYGFDPRNSAITSVRATPQALMLEVLAHYATGSIVTPQAGAAVAPSVPRSVPDPRSLFMTLQYALSDLPEQPMPPRLADPRLGHFTTVSQNLNNDTARTPAVHYVQRWRLEKKVPEATLSEPVKPLVYWLDRSVPLSYRQTITAGILEWNKAFERIGFSGALQVKVQPEEADFDTLDPGLASVRWMSNSAPTFAAIGTTHVDPRSGEILGSNIALESLAARAKRAQRAQVLQPDHLYWQHLLQTPRPAEAHSQELMHCEYADMAAQQLSYGLDVLASRGEVDLDSPEAQGFVLDYLKDITLHEVGHTLGLRHNFRASTLYTEAQLSDPEFTRNHAAAGSVMEYAPINLASPGAPAVAPFQSTLGPYDFWAIEYAYKPLAAEDEEHELARIAARSREPELAFATDEDHFLGLDPEALHYDLGKNPVAFARKRLEIARDLFQRQESRVLPANQSYAVLRRSLDHAVADAAMAAGVLARQIGGVRTLRDQPGSGRDPLQPVGAALQREALQSLSGGVFAADSFTISATLQRRLAPDFQERGEAVMGGEGSVQTDFSLGQRVLGLQRGLLAQLLSDPVANRIIENQARTAVGEETFTLNELYERLERDIWSELGSSTGMIPLARRELQREHLNRVASFLLNPAAAASRADARSLVRARVRPLLNKINVLQRKRELKPEVRAHLQDATETLMQALSARTLRLGI
jgi:hypothetical protein